MKVHALHLVTVFLGFFAVMNPLANTPIFLGLTEDMEQATKRRVARNALLLTFIIVVGFSAAGRLIFELFGITLPAFRITGGLLVGMIGVHMLNGGPSKVHAPDDAQEASADQGLSVAISPLAIPLLAGPGTIATAMSFTAEGGVLPIAGTAIAFLVLCLITYVSFVSGQRLIGYLGQNAIGAMTRMMGLILAVIGTQMVIEGVQGTVAGGAG